MNNDMREFVRLQCQEMRTKTDLHAALTRAFPDNPVSYQTVTREARKALWSSNSSSDSPTLGRPRDEDLSGRISRYLEENPYASLRAIAAQVGACPSTVRQHLLDDLGYQFKKTRWIPHMLDEAGKKTRVAQSSRLLEVLATARKSNFRFLLTGDESWFFYYYPSKGRWIPSEQAPDEEQSGDHFTSKVMITVFWGMHGAAVIDALPNGCSMNARHFADVIIPKLRESEAYLAAKRGKKRFILHMDNSPIHRSATVKEALAAAGIETAPHPPYSPDLAPSDFYLFGKLKNAARNIQFGDVTEIEGWIKSQFDAISQNELKSVFEAWERRLKSCVEQGGSFVE